MDLGGLQGFSCADHHVSPIRVGCSCPGCKGVRLDLHQATHDGFCWPEYGACGGGACGGGGAGAVMVMLCSSTINQVGHICWALGPVGVETESS